MTPRTTFDNELEQLNILLIKMGGLIENAIEDAIDAFKRQDFQKAKGVIEGDREVDEIEKQIEAKCLSLILRQQPVAIDLRKISTALKMITDMERIGDNAADIAELILEITGDHIYETTKHIPKMASIATAMVHDSISSYVKNDIHLAREVMARDDEVDLLFIETKAELAEILKLGKDTQHNAIDFLMIAKYLERIADHAVNICEWVEFAQSGQHGYKTIL